MASLSTTGHRFATLSNLDMQQCPKIFCNFVQKVLAKNTLVVFPDVKNRIISMLNDNLSLIATDPTSDKIQLTKEVCESLLRQKDTKIISFTQLIKKEMPSLLIYWK